MLVVAMTADVLGTPAIAIATGVTVGSVAAVLRHRPGATGHVWPALIVLISLLLIDQLLASLAFPLRRFISARVDGNIRKEVRRLLSVPPGIGHLEESAVRDDAHRCTRGIGGRTLGAGVASQLGTWFTIAGACLSALAAAFVAPDLALWTFVGMVVQRELLRRQITGYVGLTSALTSNVRAGRYWLDVGGAPAAAKEVRLFGLQEWVVDRQFETAKLARKPVFDSVDAFNKKQWVPFTTGALSYLVPLIVLAHRAASGHMSPGRVAFVASALLALGSIGSPGFDAFDIQAGMPCLDAFRRLSSLDGGQAQPHATREHSPKPPPGVCFEGVSFNYPGRPEQVLKGLDLEIPAGQSLAIVGANGAGKTTLMKLMTRLYEPTEGRILVDGEALSDLDAREWRQRISAVFQDFVHYELPAVDNVGLADLGAVRLDLVAQAAAEAGIGPVIERLDEGWQSILSRAHQGGTELSGGQWQRIALARLLYGLHAGRGLLILDEPTAHLDAEAEVEIFDRLLDAAAGRTVVLVSHRFSTVRRADRIAVISDGVVTELGSHAELLRAGGSYAEMFHTQADRYLSGAEPEEVA
jgi:ATP-binding cassette, subfamily B, bacterial